MGYFTQTDLENALSAPTVLAIYDDDRDGVVDTVAIDACIAYGSAMCDSFLRKIAATQAGGSTAATLPLTTVPDEVKFAAVDFGVAYSMRRRRDITAAMGESTWMDFYNQAVEQMKRYVSAMQVVSPTAMGHATVGASIYGAPTGTALPVPRWGSFGDFS